MTCSSILRGIFALLGATTAAACLAGCESAPLRFRVVDGVTAQPLSGVRLSVWQRSLDLPTGPREETVSLAPSGEDGIISVEHLRPWNHLFLFEKEGYAVARAEQLDADPDVVLLPTADPRRRRPTPADEVIDVRMVKATR
jgi:hypothetical protein